MKSTVLELVDGGQGGEGIELGQLANAGQMEAPSERAGRAAHHTTPAYNHDRIDNWSMVDRAAPYVVGGYLWDRSREPLYELARSPRPMERRTAIVATYYFIRQHDLDDTFRIGGSLAHDPDELVQKAVGGWVREAGKQDVERLRRYLDEFAPTMPRTALRYAVEHLDASERERYLGMKARAAEARQP